MYPALPEKVAICDGKLLVYSDTHIDVFDTQSGDWVQSINIRKTRPLLKSGHLNLSMLQEMPHVTFLSNISRGMYQKNFELTRNLFRFHRKNNSDFFFFHFTKISFFQMIVWMWWNQNSWLWDEMGDLFNVPDDGFRSEKAINKSDRKFLFFSWILISRCRHYCLMYSVFKKELTNFIIMSLKKYGDILFGLPKWCGANHLNSDLL